MTKGNIKRMERTLKALANRRRLAVLAFLKQRKEATVGEIAEEIRLSFKSTSRHLSVLASADIVNREQRSLEVFYSLADDMPSAARLIRPLL